MDAQSKPDISDVLSANWKIKPDRTGADSAELVAEDGACYISVRLMGRDHADEVELARAILARMWPATPT